MGNWGSDMSVEQIVLLRNELNDLDSEMVALLVKRAELARQIVAQKKRDGQGVEDRVRESEILERLLSDIPQKYHDLLHHIYQEIFRWVKQ